MFEFQSQIIGSPAHARAVTPRGELIYYYYDRRLPVMLYLVTQVYRRKSCATMLPADWSPYHRRRIVVPDRRRGDKLLILQLQKPPESIIESRIVQTLFTDRWSARSLPQLSPPCPTRDTPQSTPDEVYTRGPMTVGGGAHTTFGFDMYRHNISSEIACPTNLYIPSTLNTHVSSRVVFYGVRWKDTLTLYPLCICRTTHTGKSFKLQVNVYIPIRTFVLS